LSWKPLQSFHIRFCICAEGQHNGLERLPATALDRNLFSVVPYSSIALILILHDFEIIAPKGVPTTVGAAATLKLGDTYFHELVDRGVSSPVEVQVLQ
jgi:hypothetical protein